MPTLEEWITALMSACIDSSDYTAVEELAGRHTELNEPFFREAVRSGAFEYVEAHSTDVELNDGPDGFSTYFDETKDPEMAELLTECGAFSPDQVTSEAVFVYELRSKRIIMVSAELLQEALERYEESYDLTESQITEALEEETDTEELPLTLRDDMNTLGVSCWNGQLLPDPRDCEDGDALARLLERLGWEMTSLGGELYGIR